MERDGGQCIILNRQRVEYLAMAVWSLFSLLTKGADNMQNEEANAQKANSSAAANDSANYGSGYGIGSAPLTTKGYGNRMSETAGNIIGIPSQTLQSSPLGKWTTMEENMGVAPTATSRYAIMPTDVDENTYTSRYSGGYYL